MPERLMVPTMMPITPTVAPMISVLRAPSIMASRICRQPILWSGVNQLTTTQLTVATTAAKPAE